MKKIVVANQKGGVAKTTTSVNLASYLGSMGKRVLLIDLDPQGNATSGLGIEKEGLEKGIYDAIIGNLPLSEIIRESSSVGVSVAPADISLVGAEVELVGAERRESRLSDAINKNDSINQYDFIIMDTPPSLGLLTVNAFTASDSVLIPMQCEYYALEGLAQLYKTIQFVRQKSNPNLAIEGLVFSMVDPRANLTIQVMNEVKKILKEKVYETVIPRNVRLAEAPSFGKPILLYDKASRGAEAYEKLAQEFLARNTESVISAPAPAQAQAEEAATPIAQAPIASSDSPQEAPTV